MTNHLNELIIDDDLIVYTKIIKLLWHYDKCKYGFVPNNIIYFEYKFVLVLNF